LDCRPEALQLQPAGYVERKTVGNIDELLFDPHKIDFVAFKKRSKSLKYL